MLKSDPHIVVETSGFQTVKNYSFYRKGAQPPRLYQHILSAAKISIDIWDPYFTEEAAHVFDSVRQDHIKINILTKLNKKAVQTNADVDAFVNKIKNILEDNDVKPEIEIYCITKNDFERNWHDRYLVIDDTDAYLIGTSIDEQINPIKDFGIYHVTDINEVQYIKQCMQYCKSKCVTRGYPREINCYARH